MASDGTEDKTSAVENAARSFIAAAKAVDNTGTFARLAEECDALDKLATASVAYIKKRNDQADRYSVPRHLVHSSTEGRDLHEAVDKYLAIIGESL